MSLLALARRFLQPGYKAESEQEQAEEAAFRKRAGEVWLAYQNNETWARRKLEAGLTLTPEALDYMEREIETRAAQAAHEAAIKKEIADDDARERGLQPAAPVPAAPPGDDQPHRDDAGDGSGGA